MEKTLNKLETKPCTIHGVVCCGVLEKMNLGWMKIEDGTKCMPYIKGHSDEVMYRVNNCPSCGKYVRDVMIQPLHTTAKHWRCGGIAVLKLSKPPKLNRITTA